MYFSPFIQVLAATLGRSAWVCVSALLFLLLGCSPDTPENGEGVDAGTPSDYMSADKPGVMVFDIPDAESEQVPSWVSSVENDQKAEFSVVADGFTKGSYALRVDLEDISPQNTWDVQVFRPRVSVHSDQVYHYTAWVKGPAGAKVNFGIEEAGYNAVEYKELVLVGKWQKVAMAFIPSRATIRSTIHFAFAGNSGESIYVDNIRIDGRSQ